MAGSAERVEEKKEEKPKEVAKKGAPKGKKGAAEAERVESPALEDAIRAKADPNYRKFIPGIIHLRKDVVCMQSEF